MSSIYFTIATLIKRLVWQVLDMIIRLFLLIILKMFNVEDARPYAVNVDGRDLIEPIQHLRRITDDYDLGWSR